MQRVIGLIGMLFALAVGAYIYTQQAKSASQEAGNPRSTVDIVGLKMDLNSMAQAERLHFARESHYASLDELRNSGDLTMQRNNRGPYTFSASVSDNGFVITATSSEASIGGAPASLSIDESMQIR